MSKARYDFTLKGDDINFAGSVGTAVARSMLDLAMGVRTPSTSESESDGVGKREKGREVVGAPEMSVREFLNAHNARRIPEKIAAIGEYLNSGGTEDFSRDDVLAQFRIAREAMPGNFRRDFNWAIATGWIAEDPKTLARFYVTQSGKQAVDANFSGEITKNSGFRTVRGKRRRAK